MHNILNNPYLIDRKFDMREYTVDIFLHKDIAVETFTDTNRVLVAISSMMMYYNFKPFLTGFKFLSGLTAYYLIREDYDEEKVISILAEAFGTYERFVRDSIVACLNFNPSFLKLASYTIGKPLVFENGITVKDAVEILGAIYKISYNESVKSDNLDEIYHPIMNFTKMVKYGTYRKTN